MDNEDYAEQRFRHAVQALAQDAATQASLYPSIVVVADELALDFDNWRQVFEGVAGGAWTLQQVQSVSSLDELMDDMSGPDKPEIWLEEDCLLHPKWAEVRRLASNVLEAFGWNDDTPPPSPDLFAQDRSELLEDDSTSDPT